jgi:hypothetical protein
MHPFPGPLFEPTCGKECGSVAPEIAIISQVRSAIERRALSIHADHLLIDIDLVPPLRPELVGRIMVEAAEVASGRTKGVVRVISVSAKQGRAEIMVEHPGEKTIRLDAWIDAMRRGRSRLPPPVAGEIIMRLADTLERIHSRGPLVGRPRAHGAIGPKSVLITGEGQVLLIGEGLPALTGLLVPMSMEAAETERCLSPEQVRGEHADERSDVYALGALYYQLLSGRPYRDRLDTDQWVMTALERQQPDLPGDLGAARPQLLSILRRALATYPQDRFQTVAALRDAIADDLSEACMPPATSDGISALVAALDTTLRGANVLAVDPHELQTQRRPARVLPPRRDEIKPEDLMVHSPGPDGVIDLWIEELGHAPEPMPTPLEVAAPRPMPARLLAEELVPLIEFGPTADLHSTDLERPSSAARWLGPMLAGVLLAAAFVAARWVGLLPL